MLIFGRRCSTPLNMLSKHGKNGRRFVARDLGLLMSACALTQDFVFGGIHLAKCYELKGTSSLSICQYVDGICHVYCNFSPGT